MDQAPDTARQLDALFASLSATPWRHDFFQTLRRIEALHPHMPRLGAASQPRDEPIRLGQDPELDFAPAALQSFRTSATAPPRLGQRFFGLFGPMGPLPLHLTEYVRERSHQHGDPTLERFADIFHHRLGLLFYRAWAQAQPASQLDRPGDDAFSRWVGAICGLGQPGFAQRESLSDAARLQHAGTLAQGSRHAEGLVKILRQYFGVPIRLEQHVGQWLWLDPAERPQLQPSSSVRRLALGRTAAIGRKVWDRQGRVRLHLGPLSYAQYLSFLPGQPAETALRDWVRHYLGLGLACDARLLLRGSEVPALRLGPAPATTPPAPGNQAHPTPPGAGRLGRTAWLGRHGPHPDRADLTLRLDQPPTPRPH
ncbi:MAG: type VI secretion system baseplate subunit TssG [Leptothrix sp. (in: b-proteobacteria)]